MKIFYTFLSIIALVIMLDGCKEDEPPKKLIVGNLVVETTISTNGSGLVTIKATADNAVKFVFNYGEGLDEPFNSDNGTTTHTYLSSGTYTVKVQAISADNFATDKSQSISVVVNELPISPTGYTTPTTYAGMNLVWQDEFTGDQLNTAFWNYETGPFNNELQYYKQQNTSVHNGYLIIKAKIEKVENKIYTSSRLTTQNKKTFKYGRIDIRAIMPKGKGLFPALWMLGSTFSTLGWPKCGEIDIMETIGGGGRDSVAYGTAHWEFNGQHVSYGGHKGLQNGQVLGDEFHVYSIVWTPTEIKWYIDDKKYHTIDITPADLVPFTKEFFFIFNVAVGGEWAGNPDATTVFPQRMVVDYVRVFQ
jgi:beta-glucanase (GH16 family)